MDTIAFEIGRAKAEDRPAVGIFVNGMNLLDVVKRVELPFATREGNPELPAAMTAYRQNTCSCH